MMPNISDPENEFEKRGVTFKIITDDMGPQVSAFLWENFFPDEPTARSLGMVEPHWLLDQSYIMDSVKKGACVAAMNDNGEILASMKRTWVAIKLFKKINYDAWAMFDKLGCDRIYDDKAVCSGRSHGIRGLGTEICRRSEKLAADLGCTHTVAAVTGIYSQRIFTKLEHTTLTSLDYDDFRDENGELYLKDTREHTKIITCYKKLIG